MKKSLIILIYIGFVGFGLAQETSTPGDLKALISKIDSMVNESSVPAASVSIVRGDSILFATAFGVRDMETKEKATGESLFRIGSISKMFVALSILKLQEEGKISLKDRVKDLAPEIEYKNPWEDTHPILVEHLLEHTTGWDDIHLVEYAHNEPDPISLKDALDFHPHSRTSRWVPSTRYSYCNAGPPVAAYIVEKISGQSFEYYVQQNFFDPLGMETATYFNDDNYKENGVTLYKGDQPQDYWNIIMRASGSINASAMDMANMIRFFLNDGKVDSVSIISEESLIRMETPNTTLGASAGVEVGYGLNNYSSIINNILFHGHNGGVNGGSSELVYNRDYKIGFAVMVNSSNSEIRNKISKEIAEYLTKDIEPIVTQVDPAPTHSFDGLYYAINPRQQMNYFTSRLFQIKKIWSDDSLIYLSDYPSGKVSEFRPIDDGLAYGQVNKIALAITEDPLEGTVVASGWAVYAPTSRFIVWLSWIFSGLWVVGLITSGIWFVVTIIKLLIGSERLGAIHLIQSGPVLIGACLILSFFFLAYGGNKDPFNLLGRPSAISQTIYYSSLLLGVLSFLSTMGTLYFYRSIKRNFTFWFFSALSLMSLIATIYLWSHGIIGLKTWA